VTDPTPDAARAELDRLLPELMEPMGRGVDAPLPPERFQELALRVFRLQYAGNPVYGAFCRRRGRTPVEVDRWEDVPAVPTTAFKHVDLVVGDPDSVERTFRTSGTSRGRTARGRHRVPRLALYRASLLSNLEAHLVPDARGLPLVSLIPHPDDAPESSLSTMIGVLARELCGETTWALAPDGSPDPGAVQRAVEAQAGKGGGMVLVATAFALVHLLDALEKKGRRLALPEGSRILETGGFKGRSRVVSRDELYEAVEESMGVPRHRIVNEYGMTELLSQMYEPVLREPLPARRRHHAPPWLKVRALDPVSLEPVPEGEAGVLAFYDLANAGSVSAILTEDVGSISRDGLHLRGRSEGAEPRGCSLALEDLLDAREEGA